MLPAQFTCPPHKTRHNVDAPTLDTNDALWVSLRVQDICRRQFVPRLQPGRELSPGSAGILVTTSGVLRQRKH